jgi:nitrous oxidase accessory protein
VRLFSLVVANHEAAMVLLRSFFVGLLDTAERVLPALTPATLEDRTPAMRRHDVPASTVAPPSTRRANPRRQ